MVKTGGKTFKVGSTGHVPTSCSIMTIKECAEVSLLVPQGPGFRGP